MNQPISSNKLRLENICLRVGNQPLLTNFSLTVSPGNICTIMGPSGCGKSSLLDFICGSLDPEFSAEGNIYIGEHHLNLLAQEHRHIGILFQDDLLFSHLSVSENLAFALQPTLPKPERLSIIESALNDAGLSNMGDRDPETLSGGQRARVALLRTLLSSPKVLLLDEPFSKLDPQTRQQFREFVFHHAVRYKLPVLLVTHDIEDAKAAGGNLIEI